MRGARADQTARMLNPWGEYERHPRHAMRAHAGVDDGVAEARMQRGVCKKLADEAFVQALHRSVQRETGLHGKSQAGCIASATRRRHLSAPTGKNVSRCIERRRQVTQNETIVVFWVSHDTRHAAGRARGRKETVQVSASLIGMSDRRPPSPLLSPDRHGQVRTPPLPAGLARAHSCLILPSDAADGYATLADGTAASACVRPYIRPISNVTNL
ncbi:hypothetical protein DFH06DRAFT_1132087 [Mycena polygramma]|nr:hypothetical protein DFH06DRAFT_1132087 [Mycena polygramma]